MGALCVFWGALSAFCTTVQATDGEAVVEKIRAAERSLLEARAEQITRVCASRDLALHSLLAGVTEDALGYVEYFEAARALARIEARCGLESEVRRQVGRYTRNIDFTTAQREVRSLKESGLDVRWGAKGVEIRFSPSEWVHLFIRGQAISPGDEQLETSVKLIAQKNWVESLAGVASMSTPAEAIKIASQVPERWREYFRHVQEFRHLGTIEEEYGIVFFQELKKSPGLSTLFVDVDGISKIVESLGFTAKPDVVSKIDGAARESFESPELQLSAIPNWFSALTRASRDGTDLVAMIAEMHKVALQVALDQVLDMDRDQRLKMLKSSAFDQAVAAFVAKNLASAPALRTLLDDAIVKGTQRSKEMEIGKTVYLFSRQAKHFLGAGDVDRPVDLEVLDVALRDVIELDDLRKEYHAMSPQVEEGLNQVLALEAQSADWSEIQRAFQAYRSELAQAVSIYKSAQNLSPLSAGVRDQLERALDQFGQIGTLWRIADRTRPTVGQYALTKDESKRYKKFVIQVATERARLFEAIPEDQRAELFAEFSKVFDTTVENTRRSIQSILPLREELGRIRANKRDADAQGDEALVKKLEKQELEQETKIELAKDEMAKTNGQIAKTAVPSLQRALSLKAPAILSPLAKFEGKVKSDELGPLLFSGYVTDYLSGPGLTELLRSHSLKREKFFDQGNWTVFYHGAIGVVFETPIWLSFYPKLILGLARPFGKELIKSTVKNRLGRLLGAGLGGAYRLAAFGVSTFSSVLHPPLIGKVMHWIILKDLALAGIEFTGLAQVWPFNWTATGWYRYYEPYFSAAIANEGLISAKEQRNATVRFDQERQGMVDNLWVILEFKVLGIVTGALNGGWTRLDAVTGARRLGLLRSIGIAASSNRRVEADIARSWEALGGRPHELRWEIEHIERTYDAAVKRLDGRAKPRDLQKLYDAKERLILELEMAQRRWEMVHNEFAQEMSIARIDRIDPQSLKASKDSWDAKLKAGSVGYGEYQAAMRAHKAIAQILVRTEQAIEVRQNNPKAGLATRFHPSLKLLYQTVTGGRTQYSDIESRPLLSTLLRGDVDPTRSVMEASEARIENFGRATVGYANQAERELYDPQIRELQETYPNIRIDRFEESDGSGRFEVVYDLKNQFNRMAINEELAQKLGFVTESALTRGTWYALTQGWHMWKTAKPKDHVSLEEWMTSRMAQLGLTGADGKSWYEALDPMVIIAHGAVVAKMAPNTTQAKAVEKTTKELARKVSTVLTAFGPVAREMRGNDLYPLETLRRRSPFYRALIDRAIEADGRRSVLDAR